MAANRPLQLIEGSVMWKCSSAYSREITNDERFTSNGLGSGRVGGGWVCVCACVFECPFIERWARVQRWTSTLVCSVVLCVVFNARPNNLLGVLRRGYNRVANYSETVLT